LEITVTTEELRQLHKKLWKKGMPDQFGRRRSLETRQITKTELSAVLEWVGRGNGFCEPHNACMGFGFGMSVWEPPAQPGVDPEHVITVTSGHIVKDGPGFEKGWKILSPFTHSERNRQLLEYFDREAPRKKGYYEY
jgi:hypothetical protein